jgi:hypothetical protein
MPDDHHPWCRDGTPRTSISGHPGRSGVPYRTGLPAPDPEVVGAQTALRDRRERGALEWGKPRSGRCDFVRRFHRCFAASPIAVANAAAPPKTSVKTGLSLSTIRRQTRFTGRITSGCNKKEPTNTIDMPNRISIGTTDRLLKAICSGSAG